jgi:hypothetical protein
MLCLGNGDAGGGEGAGKVSTIHVGVARFVMGGVASTANEARSGRIDRGGQHRGQQKRRGLFQGDRGSLRWDGGRQGVGEDEDEQADDGGLVN